MPLIAHRELIATFVRRDLLGRYRGSFLGLLWSFLNPLFMLAIYSLVFSSFMRLGQSEGVGTPYYPLFIFTGMIPWLAFSQALTSSSRTILSNANLVKKTVFPLEVLPAVDVISGLVHSLFALTILLLAIVILPDQPLHPTVLWLPLVMMPQLLFTLGLGWFLASISVFVRDVREAVPMILMAWWFTTPILYPPSIVPKHLIRYMDLNPMKLLIDNYRRVLIHGDAPDWHSLAAVTAVGLVAFLLGRAWFMKTKRAFADVL